jgi:hypothetical protein
MLERVAGMEVIINAYVDLFGKREGQEILS